MRQRIVYCFIAVLALCPLGFGAVLAEKKTLTLDAAKEMAQAAERKAIENHWTAVISILDDGGNLLYLERMDGAPTGSIDVSQAKARSAVRFKSPTKNFSTALKNGSTALLKLDVVPFEGGIPVVVGDQIVGAIGVSGGTAETDGQVAQAGVDALQSILKQ